MAFRAWLMYSYDGYAWQVPVDGCDLVVDQSHGVDKAVGAQSSDPSDSNLVCGLARYRSRGSVAT